MKVLDRYLPRFSQIVFFVQMPHMDIEEKVAELKGSALTEADKEELAERVEHAKKWLKDYSPERYVFEIQEELPESASSLSDGQKKFLGALGKALGEKDWSAEELHGKVHELKTESGLEPKEVFGSLYISILGKDSGPKAGWFLEALDKEFLVKRFEEASQ